MKGGSSPAKVGCDPARVSASSEYAWSTSCLIHIYSSILQTRWFTTSPPAVWILSTSLILHKIWRVQEITKWCLPHYCTLIKRRVWYGAKKIDLGKSTSNGTRLRTNTR